MEEEVDGVATEQCWESEERGETWSFVFIPLRPVFLMVGMVDLRCLSSSRYGQFKTFDLVGVAKRLGGISKLTQGVKI